MATSPKTEPLELNTLSRSAAFVALLASLQREYVFTQWKGVDWAALEHRFQPKVQAAEAVGDKKAYYLALREFVFAIPDADLRLWGDDWDVGRVAIEGTYGFSVVQLDDGRVFVSHIVPESSAARAGFRRGAQILAYDDLPIQAALNRVSLLWAEQPPATRVQSALEQCRFLTRAPIGTRVRVQFQNPRTRQTDTVDLIAEASQSPETMPGVPVPLSSSPMSSDLLESGIGWIVINRLPEESVPGYWSQTLYDHFRGRLLDFARHKARALLIDLRHCVGNNHQLAARLAGFFHRQPLFYAIAGYRDESPRHPGKLKPDPRTLLRILPQDVYWKSPVAVLVSAGTMGAAEGLARAIQHAANSSVIGMTTSGGAFGPVTLNPMREVWLPEGYSITFPGEAGLNQDGVVQIESNRFDEGGVRPDFCVPRNLRTFEEQFLQGRDVELEYALQVLHHILQGRR